MSDGRMKQIKTYREEAARLELEKKTEGRFIDGTAVIEKAQRVRETALAAGPAPVLLAGSKASSRARRPSYRA